MNVSRSYLASWKWCALASLAMVLLSLIPQIHLWSVRGRDWKGAYATIHGDEFLYSAYINALIDGRPRRNDPFTGRDDNPTAPLPESTFSIQLIPPFTIALLARAGSASASTAFIVLMGAAGLFASLSVFWLLICVTTDSRLASVGTLFVLCFGASAAGQGLLGLLLRSDLSIVGFPFLRRYQPAAAFFLFFVFCMLVWHALTIEKQRGARLCAALAGLTLGVLVLSYLYLWTTAAAWLACVALLWLYFRPLDRKRGFITLMIIAAVTSIALMPYVYLVTHRGVDLDKAQILISTHQADLFRIPEMIGAFILVALALGVWCGKIKRSESRVIFAGSFALLPFVLFNQQLLTGRSMQPFHFEDFIANYAVLVGIVILATIFWQPVSSRALLWIAALCLLWGAIEVDLPTQVRSRTDVANDQMVPVLLRLKELSKQDGTLAGLQYDGKARALVFSPQVEVMRLLPTWTAQGTLLGMGGLDFGSASKKERKELLYLYLYYCGADAGHLRELLTKRTDTSFMNYYARSAIFSHERVLPTVSFHFKPIQPEEIEDEVRGYQAYLDSFSREQLLKRPVTYAVTLADSNFDSSNIDRWYERDAGERIGDYNLYRLKLRQDISLQAPR